MQRTLSPLLDKILKKWNKMAFLSGPRQVGKTTLARQYGEQWGPCHYFNWDDLGDQKRLVKDPYFFAREDREGGTPPLLLFDEIHKYARWKNYLKGAFDKYHGEFRFLITGSGRLDLFKKGGDSLLGRYFSLPLFPLTMGEVQGCFPNWKETKELLCDLPPRKDSSRELYDQLFRFSGFPDPFLKAASDFYTLWFRERKGVLIRQDIRDASPIREISLLEMLSHLIPERVGNPISLNALKEDVGVAFETVRDWVQLLASFYYLFRLTPFTASLKRTLKKEAKVYLYDWVEVTEEGFRFENLVALHLLKAVETWSATGEGSFRLHYLRDREKREVDFVVVRDSRPLLLVECKWSDTNFSPSLLYYQERLKVPVAVQLVHQRGVCRKREEGKLARWVVSADHWLQILP
ncbi:MAG: ATP-binding protein [Deltaproteobacteria bacterium]|nr:ATP-binding protein [Deltaproteobacteria bacterium]